MSRVAVPEDRNLQLSLPVVQAFAARKERQAEAIDHWERHIAIGWSKANLHKSILVFLYPRVSVVASARVASDDPAGAAEAVHEFGIVSPGEPDWEQALTGMLEQAWEWLGGLDTEAVRETHRAELEFAATKVIPVVLRFAFLADCRVHALAESTAILVWPRPEATCGLMVQYAPRSGIGLKGIRKVARGLSRSPRWVLGEHLLDDLSIPDWGKLEGLASRLSEGKRRVEAWRPTAHDPETWIG